MTAIHPFDVAFSKARSVSVQNTNFRSEMDALFLAAEHLETDAQHQHSVVIRYDSLSARQIPWITHQSTLCEQLNKLSKKEKKKSFPMDLITFRNNRKRNC